MRIIVLTWLLASVFASHAIAAEDATVAGDATLQFTYVVRDAPVWTADGKFDPAVLVKLIEASTDFGDTTPESSLRIRPILKTGALSITTTVAAHDRIWRLLKQFPAVAATWGPGNPDYAKLLEEQAVREQRTIELNHLSNRIERDRIRTLRKKHSIDAIGDPVRVRH